MDNLPGSRTFGPLGPLAEQIKVTCSVKNARFDDAGECILTLRIPDSDAVSAARLAIMRQIVFEAVFKPTDVRGEPGA